ncbi:MAG: hypothetical protein GY803_13465 [Chloroflexi bacterium]|nr:hypothetical protein [Chloroflexota bacterium]
MGGLLSQALANTVSAEQQIKALSGLPADAQQVQTDSANLINTIVPEIQQLQTTVSAFAQQAQAKLKEAEDQVSGNTPLAIVKATMVAVQNDASNLKSTVDSVTSNITASANQVFGYSNQLTTIESQLNSQKATLQGQLNTARDEETAAKKKYYYLLALGPFGLIGLAVALGLYTKWTNDVNDLESKQSALSAQISQLSMLVAATKQLGADFNDLSTKISSVKNTVNFLAGDIGSIISDVDESDTSRTIIEVHIKAAAQEVTTLSVDAS